MSKEPTPALDLPPCVGCEICGLISTCAYTGTQWVCLPCLFKKYWTNVRRRKDETGVHRFAKPATAAETARESSSLSSSANFIPEPRRSQTLYERRFQLWLNESRWPAVTTTTTGAGAV